MLQDLESGILELHWSTDELGNCCYALYTRGSLGQLALVDTFEQGPFDTSVQVAQWAWRAIARQTQRSVYSR